MYSNLTKLLHGLRIRFPLRNNNQWTESRFNAFIKGALRTASLKWPPRYQCLKDAYVDKRINLRTGRIGNHYRCRACNGVFPSADVQVDHIKPIIDPAVGFTHWTDVIDSMFCEACNLQTLCKACHKNKTQAEKQQRK